MCGEQSAVDQFAQHFLDFLPLLHGQGSLRPTFAGLRMGKACYASRSAIASRSSAQWVVELHERDTQVFTLFAQPSVRVTRNRWG